MPHVAFLLFTLLTGSAEVSIREGQVFLTTKNLRQPPSLDELRLQCRIQTKYAIRKKTRANADNLLQLNLSLLIQGDAY
jgi:hypothetical protein